MSDDFQFSPEALRQARREKDLSQSELAELIGSHRTSVARWESSAHVPTTRQIRLIAEALGKDPQWFLGFGKAATPESVHVLAEDPWLRQVPWERIQALTSGALRSQGLGVAKMSMLSGVPAARIKELIKNALPTPDEVMALRKGLGDRFDPTPLLARSMPAPPVVPKRVQHLESLSDSEKLEFLMQKVNRLELELFKMKDRMAGG